MDRGNQTVGRNEIKIMLAVLKGEGITLSEIGRALHTREQPVNLSLFHCLWSRGTFSKLTSSLSLSLWYIINVHSSLSISRCGTRSTLLKTT
jgi:hypothetical protein